MWVDSRREHAERQNHHPRGSGPHFPDLGIELGLSGLAARVPPPSPLAQLVDLVIGDQSIRASRKDPLCGSPLTPPTLWGGAKAKPRPPIHFDSDAIQSHLSRGGHWLLWDQPVED